MDSSSSKLAVTEGSSLYYSLLYCTEAQRSRVLHTLALIQSMTTALHEVSDPSVAEKKIHWWHEEIERLVKQNARHPACTALQHWLPNRSTAQACIDILSVAASERFNPAATDVEWLERIEQGYHARIVLLHHALQHDAKDRSNVPIKYVAMAHGLGQIDRLLSLPALLHKGYAVFSDERYSQFNLAPDDLLKISDQSLNDANDIQTNASTLMQWAMSQANTAFSKTHNESPFTDKPPSDTLLPLIIMSTLRQKQIQLWLKKSPNLLRETVSITPMRKFFSTYLLRRRYS